MPTPLMSFFVPSAQIRIEDPLVTRSAERATVRLQGLVTLLTAYALRSPVGCCFKPTALLGFSPSKLYRPSGDQPFPTEWTHLPFRLPLFPELEAPAGPTDRSSWALSLTGAPITDNGFSAADAGNSLGVRPSRVLHEDLGRGFARPPLTRFGS
jgi:hypothetical protein